MYVYRHAHTFVCNTYVPAIHWPDFLTLLPSVEQCVCNCRSLVWHLYWLHLACKLCVSQPVTAVLICTVTVEPLCPEGICLHDCHIVNT